MFEIQNFDVGTKFGPFTVNLVNRTGEKRTIITSEFQKQAFPKRTYLDRRVLHIHADGIDMKGELEDTIYLDEANKTATIQQETTSPNSKMESNWSDDGKKHDERILANRLSASSNQQSQRER